MARIAQILHGESRFPYNNVDFFARRGDRIVDLPLFAGARAPEPESLDAVIAYGGYMSAYDDKNNPWIAHELRFLESCVAAGIPLLGICLGSQLLARILGARVYRSPCPEFGFKRIRLEAEGRTDPVFRRLGENTTSASFLGIEWHADAWDLPSGAVRLASSTAWANQAFRYGRNVLATQFHLEFTQVSMAYAVSTAPEEVVTDPRGEDPTVFAAPGPRYGEIRESMEALLEGFLAPVAESRSNH